MSEVAFIELLEWSFGGLLLLFIITQIAIPMWQNKPYLPIFRKRAGELESELSEVNAEADEALLQRKIDRGRSRAERSQGNLDVGGGAKDDKEAH